MVLYKILADLMVAIHAAYIGFVLGAMLLIVVGAVLRWPFVRNFWFRAIHFTMIAIVVVESLFGIVCPLTTWENYFNAKAGQATYPGSFIGHCLDRIIFYHGPAWVFTLSYCLFGGVVLLTLVLCPPRRPGGDRRQKSVRGAGSAH